jgi:hypothetical protein
MGINENYGEISQLATKKELIEYVEKRFTTSFIGALDSIEQHLYDLFNDEEWNKYWPPLREELLNKGNAQKRLATRELEKYEFAKIRKVETPTDRRERNYNK